MKREDKLKLIQKTIKCLESTEERLRHRPQEKELVSEIKQEIKNLKRLLQDANSKRNRLNESLLHLKTIGKTIVILKFIGELLADVFNDLIE